MVSYLLRRQITADATLSGRAESTAHRAADLGGDADRHPTGQISQNNHFYHLAIMKQQRKFVRALVAAGQTRLDLKRKWLDLRCQALLERRRKVAHLMKINHTPVIDPPSDLVQTKRLFAGFGKYVRDVFFVQHHSSSLKTSTVSIPQKTRG